MDKNKPELETKGELCQKNTHSLGFRQKNKNKLKKYKRGPSKNYFCGKLIVSARGSTNMVFIFFNSPYFLFV
jgi:hypothetical protein